MSVSTPPSVARKMRIIAEKKPHGAFDHFRAWCQKRSHQKKLELWVKIVLRLIRKTAQSGRMQIRFFTSPHHYDNNYWTTFFRLDRESQNYLFGRLQGMGFHVTMELICAGLREPEEMQNTKTRAQKWISADPRLEDEDITHITHSKFYGCLNEADPKRWMVYFWKVKW